MQKIYCLYPQGYSSALSMFNRGCLLASKRQARVFSLKTFHQVSLYLAKRDLKALWGEPSQSSKKKKKYTVHEVKKIILSSFSHVVPQCFASPSSRAAWFSSAEVTRSRLLFLKADPIMLMSRPQTPLVARPKPAAQKSQIIFEVGFEICLLP